MGLNFRKSISLFPGVKLNLSKGGASISGGVPGLRKSINTKGQVTTTASIPGTGIYYTDKKKIGGSKKKADREKEKKTKAAKETKEAKTTKTKAVQPAVQEEAAPVQQAVPAARTTPAYTTRPTSSYAPPYSSAAVPDLTKQVDANALKTIHKMADDTVEWEEIVNSPNPPDSSYNPQMWAYYYAAAPAVLSGDIDTYLRLIDEVSNTALILNSAPIRPTKWRWNTQSTRRCWRAPSARWRALPTTICCRILCVASASALRAICLRSCRCGTPLSTPSWTVR